MDLSCGYRRKISMFTRLFATGLLAATLRLAYAQSPPPPCSVLSNVDTQNTVAVTGESELTSDLVFTCTNGAITAGPPPVIELNIELFLNVDLTSRIDDTSLQLVDTVLLLDDPAPAVQALGTNVFRGTLKADNAVAYVGIPLAGGTHKYRITNIRANANDIGIVGAKVLADLAVNASSFSFSQAPIPLAVMEQPLAFSTSPIVATFAPISGLDLNFKEGYETAFKKRIENTAGPLTFQYQDVPGMHYCTESGFTPKFQALPIPGGIGLADTGTRLLANLTDLPPSVFVLIVPNEVTSSSGHLVAHRVLPPFGATDEFGTILTA